MPRTWDSMQVARVTDDNRLFSNEGESLGHTSSRYCVILTTLTREIQCESLFRMRQSVI